MDKNLPVPVETVDQIIKESIRQEEALLGIDGDLLDATFVPRGFVYCNLPYRRLWRPDGTLETLYEQKSARLTLTLFCGDRSVGLPYGSMPRMLMSEITQRARQSGSRKIYLAEPISHLFARWGIPANGGPRGSISRFRLQLDALCASAIHFSWHAKQIEGGKTIRTFDKICNTPIFENAAFIREQIELNPTTLTDECYFELSDYFFKEITNHPVPIKLDALAKLQRSPLAMDLYCFLTHRVSFIQTATLLDWTFLFKQFGSGFSDLRFFKRNFIRAIQKVIEVYPSLNVEPHPEGLLVKPCRPHVWRATDYGAQ